jgi:hypothetical protein
MVEHEAYYCPACGAILADNEDEAIKILEAEE